MKRAFYFNSPRWLIEVNMELKDDNTFTCSWCVWTRCYWQCREEIDTFLKWDVKWDKINRFWKKYHLNDLHPGTKKQEERLHKHWIENRANEYDKTCEALEKAWLLYDDWYKFWSWRKKEEIPYWDLKKIKQLIRDWF